MTCSYCDRVWVIPIWRDWWWSSCRRTSSSDRSLSLTVSSCIFRGRRGVGLEHDGQWLYFLWKCNPQFVFWHIQRLCLASPIRFWSFSMSSVCSNAWISTASRLSWTVVWYPVGVENEIMVVESGCGGRSCSDESYSSDWDAVADPVGGEHEVDRVVGKIWLVESGTWLRIEG